MYFMILLGDDSKLITEEVKEALAQLTQSLSESKKEEMVVVTKKKNGIPKKQETELVTIQ